MAATGYTPIKIYASTTASAVPLAANLDNTNGAELAINTNDGILYYKDSSGVVQSIASKAGNSGSFTNLAYTGTLTGGTGVVNLGSGQFYKDASGNVGIGTSSPVSVGGYGALTLNGTTGSLLYLQTNASSAMQIATNASGASITAIGASLPLYFSTNSTERMRIDTSGNLLVGTTSASATSGEGFKFLANGRVPAIVAAYTTNANSSYLMYSTGAGNYRFFVAWDGTVNATSIVISAISDERLKENIKELDTGLDSIMALKPRRFDWKDGKGQDKKNVAGFIAQEFETVFPECVGKTMAGADGIEYKNINHETLIPTLVKAIQELNAEVQALKQQLGK